MKTINNTPLALAFVIVVVVFLLFCGGAVTMTMMNNGKFGTGFMNNIGWLWIPTIAAFFLSVLLGWAIFWKKE
ncbi:MAG: hypothetical protein V1773_19435 [bacterium]